MVASLLLSAGGAQLAQIACMAGKVTPWSIYMHVQWIS